MVKTEFNAKSFELLFDEFVTTEAGGQRLDAQDVIKIPPDTKCADYFFPHDKVVVELKTLNENHGDQNYVLGEVTKAIDKFGYSRSVLDDWLSQRSTLPPKVTKQVDTKVQNSLKNVVRKANAQIKSTKSLLGKSCDGILIVANLGEYLFGPVELLRYLAGHAVGRTSLSIDAVLLLTPGVTYATSNEEPQHYIMPVYAEGKQYLGDFIEPIVEKWMIFEADRLGLKPLINRTFEIDKASRTARPIEQA